MHPKRLGKSLRFGCTALCALVAAGVLLTAGARPAVAQVDRGGVVGTVSDASGARVAGAKVTTTNLATNISESAVSDTQGNFSINSLLIGSYKVKAEKSGFAAIVEPNVPVTVGGIAKINFVLQPGSETETVEVSAAAVELETQSSSLGTVESEKRIAELPLNGRNFIALAYLGPGTNSGESGSNASGGVFENERGNEAISVNGLRVSNNNFLLNGVDNNEFGLGGVIVLPPPDAIEEFRIETNSMSAEFGRGGAAVNVVVKSGANDLHGGLYEFVRNDKLDALDYFASGQTQFQRNQFGAFFGGPIKKDRTFLFGDYEGSRQRQGVPFVSTVPTDAERTGDLSDRLTGQSFSPCGDGGPSFDTGAVFDPYSTHDFQCPDGHVISLRDQLSYNDMPNVIDPARIDQVGLNVVTLYPKANVAGLTNNYAVTQKNLNDQDSFDVRFDHHFSTSNQLFASYGFGDIRSTQPAGLGKLGGADCCDSISKSRAQHLGLGETHVFSANTLNDAHGGAFRYSVNAVPFNYGTDLSKQLGIPNANRGDANSSGLANLDIAGFTPMGDSEWLPEHVYENIFQVADTLTLVRGAHTVKVGADFRRQQRNFFQLAVPRGNMVFNGGYTQDLSTGNGGVGLGDLLLGVAQHIEQDTLTGLYPTRYWDVAGFVQDDYRIKGNITLNLGIRYDLISPANGQVANFDLAKGVMVASYGPGAVSHGGVAFDKANFGPRVGLAWTLPHDTVIHSAFGIFYSPEANTFDDLGLNPPALTDLAHSYDTSSIPVAQQLISTGFFATFPAQSLDHPQGSVKTTGPKRIIPRILEWNLSVQHEFGKNWMAQVGYVGTHAYHLWNHEADDLNQPEQPLDTNFSDATGNMGRPYFAQQPDLASIYPLDYAQLSILYHSLQASLNRKFSNGFNVLFAYTYAKDLGNADGNVGGLIQDAHHPEREHGAVTPDLRHRFTASYLYELPVGRGRHLLNGLNRVADAFVGGWDVAGVTAAQSGMAFTAISSNDLSNTGSASYRYDQVASPKNFGYDQSTQQAMGCSGKQDLNCWYNQAAFVAPVLADGQQSAHVFGNSKIGNLRGPDLVNFDFVLQKHFELSKHGQFELRAELFNLFNHPIFGLPANQVDVPGGASITSTGSSNREMELALKYSF